MKKILSSLGMVVALLGSTLPAHAEDAYPTRPITVIVPFGAGGESDIVARLLADSMSKILEQNVAVQNVVGASGVTGMNAIKTAKPDGYTLGFSPSAPLAIHPHLREVPYTLDDYVFIGRAMNVPYYLITQSDSPWKSVEDMIAALKAKPNEYYWASAGVGSLPHIAILNVLSKLGLQAKHVSFSGDPDAFQALAGGRAHLYASSAGTLSTFEVRPLALMADKRSDVYPDVPTFQELGYPINISQWGMLMAPKGTDPEKVRILSEAMAQACQSPQFKEALVKLGLAPGYLNTEDSMAFISAQSAANAALIKELAGK